MKKSNLTSLTEEEARSYIEALVWPNGATCSHCSSKGVTLLQGKSTRPGLYKCRDCRKQFTVTTGTVFEKSKIPLSKWVQGFTLMCASKKGISSSQLHRMLGVTYKCAWHMTHRIRLAMTQLRREEKSLKGDIEADETYIGGRKRGGKRGRGTEKMKVLTLVQRDGEAISKQIEMVDARTLHKAIKENVHKDSRILTDEWGGYRGIGKHFSGGHETVNHRSKEYARGDIYSNTAESYFALLKRGVNGTFHHLSKTHLNRYCHEFDFRWNHRKETDLVRTEIAIKGVAGKRLLYQDELIKKTA